MPSRGKPYLAKITSLVYSRIYPAQMAQILLATVCEKHDLAA